MLALALPAQLWMYEQRTSDLLTFTPLQHLGLTTVTATATELGLHAVGLKGTGVAVVSTSLLGVYRYSKEQFLTSGQKNAQQARNQAALAAGAAYSAMTTTRNTFNLYRHGTVGTFTQALSNSTKKSLPGAIVVGLSALALDAVISPDVLSYQRMAK
jgi:hypothetical protein